MKIDYSKFNFSLEESKHMLQETNILSEKNPTHIPILIMVKSSVLKMDKQKFLVSNDIIFSDFITNTLKKKLVNLSQDDTITIQTVKLFPEETENAKKSESTEIKINSQSMKEIYDEHKDTETNLLILKISRNTTFKYLKGSAKYWLGY